MNAIYQDQRIDILDLAWLPLPEEVMEIQMEVNSFDGWDRKRGINNKETIEDLYKNFNTEHAGEQ